MRSRRRFSEVLEAESPKKQLISRVSGFFHPGVAELFEEALKVSHLHRGNLDTRQDPSRIRSVVPVVEERDIPVAAQGIQKLHQGDRSFRELETVKSLVGHIINPRLEDALQIVVGLGGGDSQIIFPSPTT